MPAVQLERRLALRQACWAFFDGVAARVSPELRKGPRGGSRDRDAVFCRVLLNEAIWALGVGVEVEADTLFTPDGLESYRQASLAAIRARHTENRGSGTSTLAYLIRLSVYHTMDHAWEMEDRDLTGVVWWRQRAHQRIVTTESVGTKGRADDAALGVRGRTSVKCPDESGLLADGASYSSGRT